MNQKNDYHRVLSIIMLIVAVGMALGADALMAFQKRNWMTLPLSLSFFWAYILPVLLSLLLAAVSLLLFWILLNQLSRSVWVALTFLLVGLFFVAYPILLYFIPSFTFLLPPQWTELLLNPRSYIVYSGSFIVMIGLFKLVFPTGKEKKS